MLGNHSSFPRLFAYLRFVTQVVCPEQKLSSSQSNENWWLFMVRSNIHVTIGCGLWLGFIYNIIYILYILYIYWPYYMFYFWVNIWKKNTCQKQQTPWAEFTRNLKQLSGGIFMAVVHAKNDGILGRMELGIWNNFYNLLGGVQFQWTKIICINIYTLW